MTTRIKLDLSNEERLFAGIITIATEAALLYVDDDSADDVAQDVALEFLELMRSSSWNRSARTLNAFVVRRARDRCLDAIKGASNRDEREEDWMLHVADGGHTWMEPDRAMEEEELEEMHRRFLDLLPPVRRRVFDMVRGGERSYDDVARTLGITRSAVCQHVSEAQRRFRYELNEYGVETRRPGGATKRRRSRVGRSARHSANSGSIASSDDRPWRLHPLMTPWMTTAIALAARSPPAGSTTHAGGIECR